MNCERRNVNQSHLIFLVLVLLSAGYLLLAGSTVGLTTIQYDEFTDLVIAATLSRHPLSGHSIDGSQGRLPMYVTAVAYRAMQIINPNFDLLAPLAVSRWISILMSVLAIWGIYILGTRLFNRLVGVLAAVLFTLSPYVLHFGRDALTQGDAFTPAMVVFTLITFQQFNSKRTTFWLAAFAFCLALAIATKFYLVILIPAFITYQILLTAKDHRRKFHTLTNPIYTQKQMAVDRRYIFLTTVTGLSALVAVIMALQRFKQPPEMSLWLNQAARLFWVMTLIGIILSLWFAFKDSEIWPFQKTKPGIYWRLTGSWFAILPLAFAIALALFPTHIFNPYVLPSLFRRFITMDGKSNLLATFLDSARLYSGLLLFKLGLPFGLATFFALAWSIYKSFESRSFLLITVVLLFYGLLLAILPLQQPFWLMSIYPLLVIALSAAIFQSLTSLKQTKLRLLGVGYVVFAFGWLLAGLVQVYPTFGYYGYEWIGDSWLGGNSRGYRAVIIVTNDGSTQAIEWLRQHVPSDSLVIGYLDDTHIINHLESIQPLPFEFKIAQQYEDHDQLDRELALADFVVTRAIDDIGLFAPVTDPAFRQQFGTEPVHQIFRGRGAYRMPVIEIYQRISDASSEELP